VADESDFVVVFYDTALLDGGFEDMPVGDMEGFEGNVVSHLVGDGEDDAAGCLWGREECVDFGGRLACINVISVVLELVREVQVQNQATDLSSASFSRRGRPDQMTSSGSMGGMNKVRWSVLISYATYESGTAHPER
jgi:hypothetical protein